MPQQIPDFSSSLLTLHPSFFFFFFLPLSLVLLYSFQLDIVRGSRPGKQVQLAEYEIKFLCTTAREIFINQPILLELEAPIKICGTVMTLFIIFFLFWFLPLSLQSFYLLWPSGSLPVYRGLRSNIKEGKDAFFYPCFLCGKERN